MLRQDMFPVYLVAIFVMGVTVGGWAVDPQVTLPLSQGEQEDIIIDDSPEFVYMIPASAHTEGEEGTSWVSDAVLYNTDDGAATANLFFLKEGQDNSAGQGMQIIVPGHNATRLIDFVQTIFGEESASGALLVASDKELVVGSRTFNNDAAGTFGQYIPGISAVDALGTGMEARLIQLTRNADYRTNIGFANATGQTLNVSVDLHRANGNRIAQHYYTLQPYGFFQKTDIIGVNVADAYAIVRSSTPGAKYFTYASVVDKNSGDPVLILPPAEPIIFRTDAYVAGAAHVEGAAGTNWRTDLEIHNPGSIKARFRIALLRKNQANSPPTMQTFNLNAGKSVRYEDVLLEVFGFEGAGALRVTPTQGTIMVTSRTFNQLFDQTYGQFIAGTVSDEAIAYGQEGRLIQLSGSSSNSSGFRTNIGFVNATPWSIQVRAEMYTATGTLLGAKSFPLLAYEYDQADKIFAQVTDESVDNGFAIVSTTTPGGHLFAYASVVDNRSGDPMYIPAAVSGEPVVPPASSPVLSESGTTLSSVSLAWSSVTGATGYRLYRVDQTSPIYQGPNLSDAQNGLDPDTVYCYTVLAYNDNGSGPISAQKCATTTQLVEPGVWSSTGLEGHSVYSIAVCPADPATMSVGTKGHGVFISDDYGNTWQPRNNGLQEIEVLETLYPSQDCGLLFAGTWHQETGYWHGGLHKSTDEARSWTKKHEANVISLAFDVVNPNRGFFGTQGSGVYRTSDSGESWEWAGEGIGSRYVRALAISQANPEEVFAGTERGLYKSTNGGDIWFEVGNFYLIDAVAVHPENPLVIYAARYSISKSVDGGVSWELLDWNVPGSIKSIVIDPNNPSTLFIGTSDGVYMSEDDGSTWSSLNDGLTDRRVQTLALGSGSPRFLFAGTTGDWDQIGDGDVFRLQLP